MTADKVKDILSRLSANRGKAARLEAEIGKLEAEARQIRAIEITTLKASRIDGMPRGKGGKSGGPPPSAARALVSRPLPSRRLQGTRRDTSPKGGGKGAAYIRAFPLSAK